MASDEGDSEARQMTHQSRLAMWNKMHEAALHSDRFAGEIGVFVLKIVLIVNGGSLVALMGAYRGLTAGKPVAYG